MLSLAYASEATAFLHAYPKRVERDDVVDGIVKGPETKVECGPLVARGW
ncbi:hypothetical protein VD0002_g9526 [Verticillium dahliae]|uniref:Uncharacterized protein n=1 Tax=Verticillium dahliae TaxID=27337 RepID=A0A2J8E8Z3_VERDA|nr:hypothetical protein BJF96_g2413 [Verticillium dahliae]PNH38313.1 hypothetical protein VD0004_g8495 [Verticillium dahliae]PNH50297.1 hypothetical protein VD0003_g6886 [Verticillium dahliae]PNH57995.1 hypothetical protein VD0002_g9526 [Verticillium dahliae]PNH65573.1 hypothetical protein VD0001_g8440 [Verticillium dahliae]